ncbi:MAG: hypothetical protein BRC25_01825 [Parcubacteria group bacterium SW_6_46_9]|nr:MAG: hypothetical protein BRC25_01825 [Parcubacteria group bacterium SW_6_46_9]
MDDTITIPRTGIALLCAIGDESRLPQRVIRRINEGLNRGSQSTGWSTDLNGCETDVVESAEALRDKMKEQDLRPVQVVAVHTPGGQGSVQGNFTMNFNPQGFASDIPACWVATIDPISDKLAAEDRKKAIKRVTSDCAQQLAAYVSQWKKRIDRFGALWDLPGCAVTIADSGEENVQKIETHFQGR